MVKYFFAMQREADMIDVPNKYIIGINGTEMPETTKEDIIVNLGYCGAYKIPVGTIIEPSIVFDFDSHKKAKINHIFNTKRARCFTSKKFVLEHIVNFESIYDMELYEISKIPHKKLFSLKIVSDNLNEHDCENFNDKECWEKVEKILKEINL